LQQRWLRSRSRNGWQHFLQQLSLEAQPHEGSDDAQPQDGSVAAAGAAHEGSALAQPQDGSAGAAQDASSFAQPHDGSEEQLLSQQHLCLNRPRHALAWLSSATETQTKTAKVTAVRIIKARVI
jgi:hypothetical protein